MSNDNAPLPAVVIPAGRSALDFRYSPDELRTWVEKLDEVRKAVLKENTDYGIIPGTDRPSLYKPGAEKLTMLAGFLVHEDRMPAETERDGVTIRYTLLRSDEGRWVCGLCGEQAQAAPVAQAEGYAGYDESRFFQTAEEARSRAERSERRYAEKDQRAVREWKFAPGMFEDYRAPWNAVIKMAAKRAYVAATLNALAASGLFTQDVEDSQEAPAAGPAEPFDPMAVLGPHLALLQPEELKRLRDWRETVGLPTPRLMGQPEVAQTLLQIAVILRGGEVVEGDQTARARAVEPAPEFDLEGVDANGQDPGRPFDDAPAPSGAVAEAPSPSTTPEAPAQAETPVEAAEEPSWAERDFDERTAPEPAPATVDLVTRGRAIHLHRKAGALKLDAEAQRALILICSEGRTDHASQLSEEEMGIADGILAQVESGLTQAETLVEAASDYTAARP